jgi:hypothetical protein
MPGLDWQTLIALVCVALAAAWWLRRGWKWASGDPACGTGCGKCGSGHLNADPEIVELRPPRT